MMKEELLTNMQTHEAEADEEDVEAGAAEDVQVRSRLSTRSPPSSPGTREPSYLPAEFLPRPLSSSFRCILPTNTIVMGLIPAFILVLAPVPRGFDEQGVFWKDQIFVAFFAILGLMLSTITTLVRVPAFYRISRTRFTIVSHSCHLRPPSLAPTSPLARFSLHSLTQPDLQTRQLGVGCFCPSVPSPISIPDPQPCCARTKSPCLL
eukprot:1112082-Rhodomonas_salina.1